MKRLKRTALLVCAALLTALWQPAAAEPEPVPYGDVDRSGSVNAADALLALQHSVKLVGLEPAGQILADVSADGAINASDALLILQYSVRLIDRFAADEQGYRLSSLTGSVYDAREREAIPVDDSVTLMQMQQAYSGRYDLPVDAVMVYVSSLERVDNAYATWSSNRSGMRVDFMLSAGRDSGEFFTLYPERGDADCFIDRAGNVKLHAGGVRYMMPTAAYREYKWRVVERCLTHSPGAIVLEEPEAFTDYCYSQGFQDAWQETYGEPFEDPALSPAARYKANRLFAAMWTAFADEIGRRVKEQAPAVQVLVATHSLAGYGSHRMTSSLAGFTQSKWIDGVIGQVWSDAVNVPVPYAGGYQSRPFETAYFDFASLAAVQNGKALYALADAASDNPYDWATRRRLWHDTLAAQLLQPDITRFQSVIWADRSVGTAPRDYRTEQQQVYALQQTIGELPAVSCGGTQGVAVAVSDSYACHQLPDDAGYTNAHAIYGLTLPLVEAGIPLRAVSLDHLTAAADLDGIRVLVLCYDVMKPADTAAQQALADWVKAGGVLMCVGGKSRWDSLPGSWWAASGTTPLRDLIARLGIDLTEKAPAELTDLDWCGPSGFGDGLRERILPYTLADDYLVFSGAGSPLVRGFTGNVAVDCPVGKGRFLAVGLPGAFFGLSTDGPQALRDLTAYAVHTAGEIWLPSDLLLTRRGAAVVARALGVEKTLQGTFVDLFDPTLAVRQNVTLQPGEAALLMDLAAFADEKPRLVHTGGVLAEPPVEETERTVLTLTGPDDMVLSTRLTGNGRAPVAVNMTRDGRPVNGSTAWSGVDGTLLVQAMGRSGAPLTLTVTWGTDPRPDRPGKRLTEQTVPTNADGQDAAALVRHTGQTAADRRYCDGRSELVYRLDVTGCHDPAVVLDAAGNYLVEVSDHDGDWRELYNYQTETNGARVEGTGNRAALTVTPADVGGSTVLYIRLRNCDPSKGWGGCLFSYTVQQWLDPA